MKHGAHQQEMQQSSKPLQDCSGMEYLLRMYERKRMVTATTKLRKSMKTMERNVIAPGPYRVAHTRIEKMNQKKANTAAIPAMMIKVGE